MLLSSQANRAVNYSQIQGILDLCLKLKQKSDTISVINVEYFNEIARLREINDELQRKILILEQNPNFIQKAYAEELARNSELEEMMTRQKRDARIMVKEMQSLSQEVAHLRGLCNDLKRRNSNQKMCLNRVKKRSSKTEDRVKFLRQVLNENVPSFYGPITKPKNSISSLDLSIGNEIHDVSLPKSINSHNNSFLCPSHGPSEYSGWDTEEGDESETRESMDTMITRESMDLITEITGIDSLELTLDVIAESPHGKSGISEQNQIEELLALTSTLLKQNEELTEVNNGLMELHQAKGQSQDDVSTYHE